MRSGTPPGCICFFRWVPGVVAALDPRLCFRQPFGFAQCVALMREDEGFTEGEWERWEACEV